MFNKLTSFNNFSFSTNYSVNYIYSYGTTSIQYVFIVGLQAKHFKTVFQFPDFNNALFTLYLSTLVVLLLCLIYIQGAHKVRIPLY